MGSNTLTTYADGNVIPADSVNQYKTAVTENLLPRNSSGVPTDLAGSLGSSTIEWLKAHIASGYWTIGDIKPHHTFNGAAPIGQGWFPCLGGIINETNYNAIHGAGAWDIYVAASALDGKYAPNLSNGYLIGSSSTTQDGSSSISNIGNAANTVNIQHSHTVDSHVHSGPSHNHQWYYNDNYEEPTQPTYYERTDSIYNSDGTTRYVNVDTTYKKLFGVSTVSFFNPVITQTTAHSTYACLDDAYTSNAGTGNTGGTSPGTNNALSTSQDIKPNSLEVIYYIRIV